MRDTTTIKIKKYALVLCLFFSFIFSTNTALATTTTKELSWMQAIIASIDPWSVAMGGVGAVFDTLNAKKHDAINRQYFLQILAAIEQVNRKLDLVIQNSCNIYQHSIYSDYATFQVEFKNYLTTIPDNRFNNFSAIHDLSLYLPALLSKFEDNNNLLQLCPGMDQYNTLGLYLLLSNIDLTIQAEHIRQSNYILYRGNASGLLTPLAQMDPATKTMMEAVMDAEMKARLLVRLEMVVTHLKVLDGTLPSGSASAFSWRSISDKRFTAGCCSVPSYDPGWNATVSWYTFDNQEISLLRKEAATNPNAPIGLLVSTTASNGGFMTFNPDKFNSFHGVSVYSVLSDNFSFINKLDTFSYYEKNLNLFYPRHKHHEYIGLMKTELVPIVKLVNQWIKEVGNPALTSVPSLNAITDIDNYFPDVLDASYHDPSIAYPSLPPRPICILGVCI